MRITLTRHESQHGEVMYRDQTGCYRLFEQEGSWHVYKVSGSGVPLGFIASAPTLESARSALAKHRQFLPWGVLAALVLGAAGVSLFMLCASGILGVKALLIGIAVSLALTLIAFVAITMIVCYQFAKAMSGAISPHFL